MSKGQTISYLSEETLSDLGITTGDVIESIENAIRGTAENTVWCAPKVVILPSDGRYMMATLAAMDNPSLLAVKSLLLNPRNTERGLTQINALVTMMDSETGLPAAILDGNWITSVRTAGLSAVAAKYMANKDAAVATFIGCGVQACGHLKAFNDMFPLARVKLFGRGQANLDKIRALAEGLGLSTEICASGGDAIEGADLVVSSITATVLFKPLLDADRLAPGCFVASTDLGKPWRKDSFAALDRIAIDDLEQEATLPDKLVSPELVTCDLSGLVLGNFKGRDRAEDRTAFVFRGHALGDLALAVLAYTRYRET